MNSSFYGGRCIDEKAMCTLTFFPMGGNRFVLTSNRDEAPGRPTLSPRLYTMKEQSVLFPKDEMAGGTWIAASGNRRVVSLLNGGFTAHRPGGFYRKSRGLVVMDILLAENLEQELEIYELRDIEPFTLVIIDWDKDINIRELVWDGERRHLFNREIRSQIWSASLLYTDPMKEARRNWFDEFIHLEQDPDADKILTFHKSAGNGNHEFGLIMDRHFVKTRSITQIVVDQNLSMSYEEIDNGTNTSTELEFS